MSTLVADQLKPLLQRLLAMAESHDERLARLEAANSRLGNQMARIGEQLTRQSDQLIRLEEVQSRAIALPAPSAQPSRPPVVLDSGNGRSSEQIARLNEQVTRIREQFSRIAEQLNRVEHSQAELRDDSTHNAEEQQRLFDRLETKVMGELEGPLPDRVQQRVEAVLNSAQFEAAVALDEEVADGPEPKAEAHPEPAPVPPAPIPPQVPVQASPDLSVVQEEVRSLSEKLSALMTRLGKAGATEAAAPSPAPPSPAAPKPVVQKTAVMRAVVKPRLVAR
ncbi:MAG: hypothetical protein WCF85_15725 [Rhodospirillaceae bacterium]